MDHFESEINSNNNLQVINKVLDNKNSLCEIGKILFKKILQINTNERKILCIKIEI